MAKKDELDRLEEEIARLERELGGKSETVPEASEADETPSRLRGLGKRLPGRKREGEAEPAPPAEASTRPASSAASTPTPTPKSAAWVQEGGRWHRPGPGGDAPVIVRRLDIEGNVVAEAPTEDPELVALAGGPTPAPSGGAPAGGATGATSRGTRPRWVVALGILLIVIVVAAVGFYVLGQGGAAAPTVHVTTSVPQGGYAAVGTAVSFDASGTTDPSGRTLSYEWTFGDGSSGSGAHASHAYASSGTFNVTVTVSSGGKDLASKTVQVKVLAVPQPSLAVRVGGSGASVSNPVDAGTAVTFSAAGTTSQDPIQSYAWSFDDGGTATGENASHTFATAGAHTVRLTVTTARGAQAALNRTIQVSSDETRKGSLPASSPTTAQQAPTATENFTANPGGIAPVRVVVTLTYNQTGSGLPGPLGGGVSAQALNLTLRDAAGHLLGRATGANGTASITITNIGSTTLGTWQAKVQGSQNPQPQAYQLEIHVILKPLP